MEINDCTCGANWRAMRMDETHDGFFATCGGECGRVVFGDTRRECLQAWNRLPTPRTPGEMARQLMSIGSIAQLFDVATQKEAEVLGQVLTRLAMVEIVKQKENREVAA